jgi:ketosteroid isomerase-like protein
MAHPDQEVTNTVTDFVDAVNRGDQARAIAHLSNDVTIVEDLAPFRWHGPNAGPEWLLAMWQNAQRNGVSAVSMEVAPPTRIEVDDDTAYAIVPGVLTYVTQESRLRSDGILTFSLRANEGQWLINAFAWTGPEVA